MIFYVIEQPTKNYKCCMDSYILFKDNVNTFGSANQSLSDQMSPTGTLDTAEISETLDEVSVSTTFVQSRLVSVSTTTEIPSLDESRSRQPQNFPVSMSLGLDTTEFPSLDESRSRQPQNLIVSMSLGLNIN